MNQAAAITTDRFEQMPPQAMALALLVHALVALALWQMGIHRPRLPSEEPIQVTIEQPRPEPPKVEPPKPEPPKQETAKPPEPTPPVVPGLRPPAEITAENPTQVPPRERQALERSPTAPPPEPLKPTERASEAPRPAQPPPPQPQPQPPQPATPPQQQTASRAPPPAPQPAPQPTPRPAAPPPPQPPANERGTVHVPPPQPRAAAPAPQHAPAPQRAPQPAPSAPAPSPLDRYSNLSTRQNPHQLPAYVARVEEHNTAAFVNPADTYNRARVADNYLWQVVRKLIGYKYQAPGVDVDQAVTVVRVVIARNGQLLDISVAQSSGLPQIDAGVVQGVRRGSPYAPLPDAIQGPSAAFFLPLVSVNRQ